MGENGKPGGQWSGLLTFCLLPATQCPPPQLDLPGWPCHSLVLPRDPPLHSSIPQRPAKSVSRASRYRPRAGEDRRAARCHTPGQASAHRRVCLCPCRDPASRHLRAAALGHGALAGPESGVPNEHFLSVVRESFGSWAIVQVAWWFQNTGNKLFGSQMFYNLKSETSRHIYGIQFCSK